nr:oncostatin-M-specific receptor subunit beta [Nothobranchius furzeri]
MTSWFLLLLVFGWSSEDGPAPGVLLCGPQNLTLSGLAQSLLVTWEDHPSCSALRNPLVYHLTVSVAEAQVLHEVISVTLDQIGSPHSWNWTSYLPLECASHTVRLEPKPDQAYVSWTEEKTLPGSKSSKGREILPQNQVFAVGSVATFCCVVPDGERLSEMYVDFAVSSMNVSRISRQRYVLKVHMEPNWENCVDVRCITNGTKGKYGACAYVGYPPDDRDLRCETRDLESVQCSWEKGRDTNLALKSPTVYRLNGRTCDHEGTCSHETEPGEKTWTLTAQNQLGKVELQDTADLLERVHMYAPEEVTVSHVNSRNVSLQWSWKVERYGNLSLTCEVSVRDGERIAESTHFGLGLNSAVVVNLIPNWEYHVKVRCGAASHFWKWSDWSVMKPFRTAGDVPDALNIWMQRRRNRTVILWKEPLANQSHGDVTEYVVSWSRTSERSQQKQTRVPLSHQNHTLILDRREQHVVMVTAKNQNGSSPPSTIITCSISTCPDETSVKTSWIEGSSRSFSLSWPDSPAASCGYVVDWCPVAQDAPLDWLKLPPNQTSVLLTSGNFRDGLRYSLSIYACTEAAPVLLEKREGYVRETRIEGQLFKPLTLKQRDMDVEISWDRIPLTEQTALIRGYRLYYWENLNQVFNVSTDDPEATSLTARHLRGALYTFTVTAQTAVGECGDTSITSTLGSSGDDLIQSVLISLGVVFGLLFIVTFLCFRHWTCIKRKVYPPIPKPVVTDQWFSSPVKSSRPYLPPDQSLHGEGVVEVPQLLYEHGAPVISHTKPEEETPYDKPVKSRGRPARAFPNPPYKLMLKDHPPSMTEPDIQNQTHTVTTAQYKPQSHMKGVTLSQNQVHSGGFISCHPGYILVPEPS